MFCKQCWPGAVSGNIQTNLLNGRRFASDFGVRTGNRVRVLELMPDAASTLVLCVIQANPLPSISADFDIASIGPFPVLLPEDFAAAGYMDISIRTVARIPTTPSTIHHVGLTDQRLVLKVTYSPQ